MQLLALQRIPVQTGANCGLFAILAAVRQLGCDEKNEATIIEELDWLEKADPRTFIGEVLSVDLLLDLIRGISANNTPLFTASTIAFSTPPELLTIIQDGFQNGGALIVPFARPESYDIYYRLLGAQDKGEATAEEVAAARQSKEDERTFRPADAHWALVNRLDEPSGTVVLADSFEDVWDRGHGYEAEFPVERLAQANLALDGCFDWGTFLDGQGRAWGIHDIQGRAYTPSALRHKNPARLDEILANRGQEALDLAGRLVRMEIKR